MHKVQGVHKKWKVFYYNVTHEMKGRENKIKCT